MGLLDRFNSWRKGSKDASVPKSVQGAIVGNGAKAACGPSCGVGDEKLEKTSACGSACGAGDDKSKAAGSPCGTSNDKT